MKKLLATLAGLMTVLLAFHANADSLTIAVSTKGPDLYADDTPVLVGEQYLLVYVNADDSFDGVRTDGSLVNAANKIALSIKAEEGSKCPYTPITYDSADYAANGTWVIVLLDTRKADGTVGGLVAGHSAKLPGTSKTGAASTSLNSLNGAWTTTAEKPVLPAGVALQKPVITAIAQGGESVTLSIQDFSYDVNYEVQTATTLSPSAWTPAKAGVAARLHATTANVENGKLKETVPVTAGDAVRFFRVVAPGKN